MSSNAEVKRRWNSMIDHVKKIPLPKHVDIEAILWAGEHIAELEQQLAQAEHVKSMALDELKDIHNLSNEFIQRLSEITGGTG